ncbi:protoporphyrinogen oxidase [Brooklawnia cerclae]|uniref:Coproporphyrinogen III oxidase n=1 Tax=Brooklawnia cerclae TaxID=349934 RepID=A0ABX0SB14_9ACTN|nr:oxygen-dependent protoporphyrinogen oxidase [Brooklawnia cerclae]
MRCLVVGGGVTGLAAAWEACRAGAEVTVLEASDRFGGKVFTERADGFTIEHGPDSFVAYRPAALQLIGELGLDDQVQASAGRRTVFLRAGGRLRPMPQGMGMVLPTRLGPFLSTRILSWPDKLRAALDLVTPRLLDDSDVAIGAFLRRRLGGGIVTKLADPLVGGIYGASVDELSLDAVLPSLRVNEAEHRSLILAGLAQGRATAGSGGSSRGPSSPFRTLSGGLGTLVDALVASLREAGATLLTDQPVESLDDHDADAVVLAGGAASSARLLARRAPAAAQALAGVPMSSSTVVTLAYPAEAFGTAPTHHGWLESEPAPVSGITVSSAKWTDRAPAGVVLLRAFVPARLGLIAEAPDDELVDAVTAHVGAVMGVDGDPVLTRISRWSRVMPSYTVGHPGRVAAVEEALADQPRLRVAGSALHGVGVPDCIADGRRQAAAALAHPAVAQRPTVV